MGRNVLLPLVDRQKFTQRIMVAIQCSRCTLLLFHLNGTVVLLPPPFFFGNVSTTSTSPQQNVNVQAKHERLLAFFWNIRAVTTIPKDAAAAALILQAVLF